MGDWKELITHIYKPNNGDVSRSMPNLSKRSMKCLRLVWRINDEYLFVGFFGIVVEGKQRIGRLSTCRFIMGT